MSNHMTADESRNHNIACMGEDLGELYSALWQQLAWLHRKWGDYVALFGEKQERFEILNDVAPSFFGNVQTALWEDALLHVARLTDSPSSAGKPNLTLRRLPNLIECNVLRQKVVELLQKALEATDFARDWRNRRIAHRDLSLALERRTESLMPASRAHVNRALQTLGDVLNEIALEFLETTTMFSAAQESTPGGAISLLYYLKTGHKAEGERQARIKSGEFSKSDIEREPI